MKFILLNKKDISRMNSYYHYLIKTSNSFNKQLFNRVNNELGRGFLESVYEHALYFVLVEYGLNVEMQKDIIVYFRGQVVGNFKADLIVNKKIIIEIKAVRSLLPEHEAQILNYLKATNIEVGLLLNFGKKPVRKLADIYDNYRKISVQISGKKNK